jgi:hypothetical protein
MKTSRVQKLTSTLSVGALLLLLTGCASSSVKIQSTPEGADVYLLRKDASPAKLGKTPLDLNASSTPELFSELVRIEVRKDGFLADSIAIPKAKTMGEARFLFTLKETNLPAVCVNQDLAANEIARGVAEVSTMLGRRRYLEADSLLRSLTAKFNTVSVLFDLQGNLYFLQKDFGRALESYKRSNDLAPNNPVTQRMLERLIAIRGGKSDQKGGD